MYNHLKNMQTCLQNNICLFYSVEGLRSKVRHLSTFDLRLLTKLKHMKDFMKYLTPGKDDTNWGIYLNVAGKANAPPGMEYPSPLHPSGYYFTWEYGRILHEYQVNYITDGGGSMRINRVPTTWKPAPSLLLNRVFGIDTNLTMTWGGQRTTWALMAW